MAKFIKFLKDAKKKQITLMLIPHTNAAPKTLSIPSLLIYIISVLLFISLTVSCFIITRHIDYLNAVSHNIILQNKLEYFSKELIKNRNFLAKLKETDAEMRTLLGLKSKKAIVDATALGGPEIIDEIISRKLTEDKIIFTVEEFNLSLKIMAKEIETSLKSSKHIFNHIHKQRKIKASKPNIWPTTGYISSGYGYRIHPMTGRSEFHKGIDIANRKGTPVLATSDGKVRYAGWLGGYGKLVLIKHGYGYTTLYGHLSKILVKKGAYVKKGTTIGRMGATGVSTGSHLHYEVRYNNKPKNPFYYVGRKKRS